MESSAKPSKDGQIHSVDSQEVGKRARKGAVWSVLQIGGRQLISIGSTAILARLVTPDDYGLLGMVTTLTALLLVFSDMGLSWATVQRKELSQAQVSNLFWLNAVAGLLLWGLCILLAPWVASFYARDELQAVTVALGATFVLGGLAAQPFALMTRRMQFKQIAKIEIAALAAAAMAGVAFALMGWGYWALVSQALVGQGVRLLLALFSAELALQRPRGGVGTTSLVRFGGLLAINGLLIYFARNLDNVLIGKVWGTDALGYYNRAYFLMLLPSMLATGVLTGLMVPTLSSFQNDPARFGSAYRRAVRLVAFFGCPIAVGLALTAPEAVRLVYGEKWGAVVPMLMWLSIAGVTQPIYNTTGWLFTAAGKARLYLALTAFNAAALTVTFFATVPHGPVAVATGYGLVMGLVLLWPAMHLAHKAAGLQLAETVRTLAPVAVALLLMAATVFTAGLLCNALGLPWLWVFGVKVFTGVLGYLLASRALLHRMLTEDVLSMLPARLAGRAAMLLKSPA